MWRAWPILLGWGGGEEETSEIISDQTEVVARRFHTMFVYRLDTHTRRYRATVPLRVPPATHPHHRPTPCRAQPTASSYTVGGQRWAATRPPPGPLQPPHARHAMALRPHYRAA